MVVEVVLAGHRGTAGGEDPAEGVTDGRPAGAAEVDRAGGVGGDELKVDLLPVEVRAGAVGVTGGEDVGDQLGLGIRGEADVQEAGPGDAGLVDAVDCCEGLGEPGPEFTGVPAFLAVCRAMLVA